MSKPLSTTNAPTGAQNVRHPSSAGGGAKLAPTEAKKKRVCDGSKGCNDFHCSRITNGEGHNKGYKQPTTCYWASQTKGCFICSKSTGSSDETKICQFGANCRHRNPLCENPCKKVHPDIDAFQNTVELTIGNFPTLGNTPCEVQTPGEGPAWTKVVCPTKEATSFSTLIDSIINCFPVPVFGNHLDRLKKRLELPKTPKEFLECGKLIKNSFDAFISSAEAEAEDLTNVDVSDEKLSLLFTPFMKNVFGIDDEFPDLPEDALESILIVSLACEQFVPIFDGMTTTLSVVEESANSNALITNVLQLLEAIRQLESIEKSLTEIDLHSAGPVMSMIIMLKSISASNFSSTTWCSSSLINGVLISATQLLEQVREKQCQDVRKETERVRNLLMNPNNVGGDPSVHFMAYLYAMTFHFDNASIYSSFEESLKGEDLAVFKNNFGKFFKCLVAQIYKHLVSKPAITKGLLDEKDGPFLLNILSSALDSMKIEVSQNPDELLKFLREFKTKTRSFSESFVDGFLYKLHVFPGKEGCQPMSKLLNWYLTIIKGYFKLSIHHGEDFRIFIHVSEEVVDSTTGEIHLIKVDISEIIMSYLFDLVCYAEVCRSNKKPFPFGNIGHESSLALEFNKIGKTACPRFQGYRKGIKGSEESLPHPYDPSFKTNASTVVGTEFNSNEDVVKYFLSAHLKRIQDELDPTLHDKLKTVHTKFSPPNGDFSFFYRILALFGSKENASIGIVLKGIQILLLRSDSKVLVSLLTEKFESVAEPVKITSEYFLNTKSEAKNVSDKFVSRMQVLMGIIMTSGITKAEVDVVHGLMRKFYMEKRSELYLHPCLIAIILALTRTYKITFKDVYNIICSGMKNQKWMASEKFSSSNPHMESAIAALQTIRTGDFCFVRFIDSKSFLSKSESFVFDGIFRDVISSETKENLNIIQDLLESVAVPLLFDVAFTKIVSQKNSSLIDLLNTVLGFRLTGNRFKDFMTLFGIDLGEIAKNDSQPLNPTNFLGAFNEHILPTITKFAKSKLDLSMWAHKKENPMFLTALSRAERLIATTNTRNHVRDEILMLLLKTGFGFNSISLDQLKKITPLTVFLAVKQHTNVFNDQFFKALFDAIYDGLYMNTHHGFIAQKQRRLANSSFNLSRSGEQCGAYTLADQLVLPDECVPKDSSMYHTIEDVFKEIQRLFLRLKLDIIQFEAAIKGLPLSIMCCHHLTPLFDSEKTPDCYPVEYTHILTRYLGNLVSDAESMGGVETFDSLVKSGDCITHEFASLIGYGRSDGVFPSDDDYDDFAYLLSGIQHFLTADVIHAVNDILPRSAQDGSAQDGSAQD